MYQTCISCTYPLGTNQVLETLPIGRRIAFDGHQGRLWVICSHCAKWNLVPFDNRLDTIDACERLFRATSTRYSTDHIGLARLSEGLDLIRIGPALGQEFAAWRYGRAFISRRRRHRMLATAVSIPTSLVLGSALLPSIFTATSSLIVISGISCSYSMFRMGLQLGHQVVSRRRLWLRTRDPSGNPVTLHYGAVSGASLHLVDDQIQLRIEPSPAFRDEDLVYTGETANELVMRILGRLNVVDGSPGEVKAAVDKMGLIARHANASSLLEVIGTMRGIRDRIDRGKTGLATFGPQERLAYEMWGNEETERNYLAGELKLLERQWRDAEALAKIADGLLPLPEASPNMTG